MVVCSLNMFMPCVYFCIFQHLPLLVNGAVQAKNQISQKIEVGYIALFLASFFDIHVLE